MGRFPASVSSIEQDDPYEDVDLSSYPQWWLENIEEYREFGLRPYRPPRFEDGTLTPPLILRLEDELDVSIRFQVINPDAGGSWELVVDGRSVTMVERERLAEGFTRYDLSAKRFETLVREEVQRS